MLLEAFAIVVMLGVLSVLIIVHEFGHFSVARLFGFQTPVFGFGLPFGPYKVVGHKWGTEFRVHACLLGGYVAIPELGDESNAKEENYGVPLKPFRKFPIWQRALVAFAGVGFNILFAWFLMYTMLAWLGEPMQPVMVARLPAANPIAKDAGVKAKDRIASIDDTKIDSPEDIVHYLSARPTTQVILHIDRPDGKLDLTKPVGEQEHFTRVDIPVTTNANGKVGMELIPHGAVHYKPLDKNPIELAGMSTDRLWKTTTNMLDTMGQMFQGLFSRQPTPKTPGVAPKLGLEDLHGVLMVVTVGAEIAKQDWSQLFIFTILISLDLAIINLVPWPALDGFHLASMMLEAVRGKPMEERAQGEIVKWGFISLLVLMAVIMVNDVRSLVTGEFSLKMKGDSADGVGGGPTLEKNKPAGAATGQETGDAKPEDNAPQKQPDTAPPSMPAGK